MTDVTYITNVRIPTHKAHGLQVMKSCEAFVRSGHGVRLIIPRLKPAARSDPFDYYGIERPFPVVRTPVLEVTPLARWLGGWISHVQNVSFSVPAVLYAWVRGLLSGGRIIYTRDLVTALVLTAIGKRPVVELHDYRSASRRWSTECVFARARFVIMNSEGTRRALARHYDLPDGRILVAPNGVDPVFFDVAESVEAARERLGLPRDGVLAGYVGMLETVGKEKGVRALVEMFAHGEVKDTHLLIVGGPGERAEAYQALVRKLGQADRITVTGHVGYRDVPLWLRALDILLLPASGGQHGETTSPIKLFEYLAAGKAILAADIPAYRAYLNEGNAAFYRRGDTQDFTRALLELAASVDRRARLGRQAREDAQRHTWQSRAERITAALHA